VFVVDTGGAPRAFVGQVARGYEHRTPLTTRLTDDDSARLTTVDEPWAASYTIASPAPRPALAVRYDPQTGDVMVKADRALGAATIRLLDHHRVALATRKQTIREGDTVFAFQRRSKVGALYVQVGAFRDWVVGDAYGDIAEQWGALGEPDEATP